MCLSRLLESNASFHIGPSQNQKAPAVFTTTEASEMVGPTGIEPVTPTMSIVANAQPKCQSIGAAQ